MGSIIHRHYLNPLDNFSLQLHLATSRSQLIQCVWLYDQPVSFKALHDFHENFSQSVAGRLIKPSAIPFGRPRWVKGTAVTHPITICDAVLPRSRFLEWADGQASARVDPVQGAGWILSLQNFDDGSAGISLVCSHVIGDGIGGMMAIYEAIIGITHTPNYDHFTRSSSLAELVQDSMRLLLDLPVICASALRSLPTLVQLGLKLVQGSDRRSRQLSEQAPDQPVNLPRLTCRVESRHWRRQARRLGGNGFALLAAMTTQLAVAYGRCCAADGSVTLFVPINTRQSLDDDRALAFDFAKVKVNPQGIGSDLSSVSNALARIPSDGAAGTGPAWMTLLPLVSFLPRSFVRAVADLLFDYSRDLPVTCSNLGDLPSDIADVAGVTASSLFVRGIDSVVYQRDLERTNGHLVVVASRINGRLSISIEAFQLGATNSRSRLADTVAEIFAGYGVHAVIEV